MFTRQPVTRLALSCSLTFLMLLLLICSSAHRVMADEAKKATYVGSKACGECHEEQYQNYQRYAKKSHSYRSVATMEKKLTSEELSKCYGCHTTGYGKPGGFVSVKKTPELQNTGCEACHGPGSIHVESEEAKDIKGTLVIDDCLGCHNAERVGAFRFRPLIYGGGH